RTARAGKKGNAISLVEMHDQPMMDRVARYVKEDIKERFIKELRPKHKKPTFKKKNKKKVEKKSVKKKVTKKKK
ncbi:ATP-dependent RNA helicase SrmB, partial [Vibrio campbellii]